jgi:hypothetical protein
MKGCSLLWFAWSLISGGGLAMRDGSKVQHVSGGEWMYKGESLVHCCYIRNCYSRFTFTWPHFTECIIDSWDIVYFTVVNNDWHTCIDWYMDASVLPLFCLFDTSSVMHESKRESEWSVYNVSWSIYVKCLPEIVSSWWLYVRHALCDEASLRSVFNSETCFWHSPGFQHFPYF